MAAKLVTYISLEAFSLTGFGHDEVCRERARSMQGACRELTHIVKGTFTEGD